MLTDIHDTDLPAVKTVVDAILADTGTDGVKIASAQTVATVTNLTNLPTMPTDWVTAAGLKADAVTEIQSGLATAAALDAVDNFIDTEVAAILAAVDTEVAAIKAKTDNLPASPAAVGSAMTLTAAYDKAKDDVLTPLAVVDGIVDAIKVQTDKIPASPASAGEYTAAIAAIPTAPLLAANYTAPDNASIATIKAKTNLIPANPAVADEYDAALAAIQADLDNPNQYKADVSGIPAAVWGYATRTLSSFGSLIADIWSHVTRTLSSFGFTVATNSDANVTAIKAKTDNLPANTATALAAIQSDLDNPAQYKADVSGLATTAHVQEVENKIDAIDVTVNTIPTNPLLDTAYTAPDNASIAAILEDTGATIPATLAGLATSAEVTALSMLDEVVVGSYTMQDILKILAAKMVGKATGGGTTTITYRGLDDTSDVIIETVDSNGNRSAVTLTV